MESIKSRFAIQITVRLTGALENHMIEKSNSLFATSNFQPFPLVDFMSNKY